MHCTALKDKETVAFHDFDSLHIVWRDTLRGSADFPSTKERTNMKRKIIIGLLAVATPIVSSAGTVGNTADVLGGGANLP